MPYDTSTAGGKALLAPSQGQSSASIGTNAEPAGSKEHVAVAVHAFQVGGEDRIG